MESTCSEHHDHWRLGPIHALATCDRLGGSCCSNAPRHILSCVTDPEVPDTDSLNVELVCLLWRSELLSCGISKILSKPWSVAANHSRSRSGRVAKGLGTISGGRHGRLNEETRKLVHKHLLELGFESGIFCIRIGILDASICFKLHTSTMNSGHMATSDPRPHIFAVEAQPPHLDCGFPSLDNHAVTFCALHILRCLGDYRRFTAFSGVLQEHWDTRKDLLSL